VDLTPRPIVNDLFQILFKTVTEENVFYYQKAYRHLSINPNWDTLEMEIKQKQIEEDIKQMQQEHLFEKSKPKEVKEEPEEKKEPEVSPPFRTGDEFEDNAGGEVKDVSIEDIELVTEDLPLLSTIAPDPEAVSPIKTINYT
jgi:hypothetical protein